MDVIANDLRACVEPTESIRFDFNNMLDKRVGYGRGVSAEVLEALRGKAAEALSAVQAARGTGWLEWTELPYQDESILSDIKDAARDIRERCDAFVLLGIGGSALGPACVHEALHPPRANELPAEKRGGPRMYFEDNIDPERMASLLEIIDPAKTCFNIITKSGATAETMSQYLIIRDALQRAFDGSPDWRRNIVVTTSANRGLLVEIARLEGFRSFVVPEGVGGRFSELSPVGLLAAAVGGVDICQLLKGAAVMDELCKQTDIMKNPALLEAALQFIASRDLGRNINVMMPYADGLRLFADWFCQLWAESLGKSVTRSGAEIYAGQTPVKALGVTDQHSQLQLYTEGPFDKVITIIKVESFRNETIIPHAPEGYPADIAFLGGITHNKLIEAERQGTEYALLKAGRMNKTIIVPSVCAYTVGQLLFFFEMATAFMGELLNIDAFNQPGVEESKLATFATLNHPAAKYEAKRREMAALPERDQAYIL
ncbi:MAG: glucose-6-phosphate isomerase [Oscillospiraceae bacterium]|jgi:glucose-6-phosphate isomerase|nr:glucose-6-phosphate isomerase [Oscillospiraceae bacterium]